MTRVLLWSCASALARRGAGQVLPPDSAGRRRHGGGVPPMVGIAPGFTADVRSCLGTRTVAIDGTDQALTATFARG